MSLALKPIPAHKTCENIQSPRRLFIYYTAGLIMDINSSHYTSLAHISILGKFVQAMVCKMLMMRPNCCMDFLIVLKRHNQLYTLAGFELMYKYGHIGLGTY